MLSRFQGSFGLWDEKSQRSRYALTVPHSVVAGGKIVNELPVVRVYAGFPLDCEIGH